MKCQLDLTRLYNVKERKNERSRYFVFEETYIDPYVIANSSPEKELKNSQSDTLAFKDIPNRFIDAIKSMSEL